MNLLITGAWGKEYIKEIESMGHRVAFMQWEKDELPCDTSWVEGVICNGLFLYHSLDSFPNLRYIQLTSAGFDRVDMAKIKQKKIVVHNAKGIYSAPMAEFAVAGVLFLYKQLSEFREQQERREWKKIRDIKELGGKRVVIIGCGDTGTACAKRFKAFDCKVIGVNRTVKEIEWFDLVVGLERLDTELKMADVAIVTIALTEETKGIVKAKNLRPEAILVNISRGGVVNLDGADCQMILDVFDKEPLESDSSLWSSAMITPHNSFVGEGNKNRLSSLIMKNLGETIV